MSTLDVKLETIITKTVEETVQVSDIAKYFGIPVADVSEFEAIEYVNQLLKAGKVEEYEDIEYYDEVI